MQYYLYKIINGMAHAVIFTIQEDDQGRKFGWISYHTPWETLTPDIAVQPVEPLRREWLSYKASGWKETGVCPTCEQTTSAGDYFHFGQCSRCEYAVEEEAQRESLWLESQMDG